jgi:diguanylate cyclase (GGDEF)-like protein
MHGMEKSLQEQLRIDEREIAARKALFHITDADIDCLFRCKSAIGAQIDDIVADFYAAQVQEAEIARIIGDRDTLQRMHVTMRRYILDIFSGLYDADYVAHRLKVGRVHERMGVTPKLYMSAVRMLYSHLGRRIDRLYGDDVDCGRCEALREALHKVMMFDTQLVFDTYIGSLIAQVNAANKELEAHAASLEDKVAERTRQLEDLSLRDPLTGLYNRRAFYEALRRELVIAERRRRPLALLYIDLNGFKAHNDAFGHLAGDQLLHQVADSLSACLRADDDIAARYGGDEFCVILPGTRAARAEGVCRRVAERFESTSKSGVTFAFGIVEVGPDAWAATDEVVRMADEAMYRAKARSHAEGGHRVEIAAALVTPPPDLSRPAE